MQNREWMCFSAVTILLACGWELNLYCSKLVPQWKKRSVPNSGIRLTVQPGSIGWNIEFCGKPT
jgi:hypothetical protein